MMDRRAFLRLVLAFVTLGVGSLQRVATGQLTELDLTNIDRHIQNQPQYASQRPLYGLLVLGPKGTTRVWTVFDKSAPASSVYDVLYFDRNANGDLTEANERIVGKPEGKESLVFTVGSFKDSATGEIHTGIAFQTWLNEEDNDNNPFTIDFYVEWQGKHVIHCGFDERPSPECQFTDKPTNAPVYWLGGDAPLRVNRWGWEKLAIGQSQEIRVLLGYGGIGRGSFSALSQDYLPADLSILATLIYTDTFGKEQRVLTEMRGRC